LGISFKPLWKLLIDRGMKKTDLLKSAGLSPPTLAKLTKNKPIDSRTLEKICAALQCQPGDVIEYVSDKEN